MPTNPLLTVSNAPVANSKPVTVAAAQVRSATDQYMAPHNTGPVPVNKTLPGAHKAPGIKAPHYNIGTAMVNKAVGNNQSSILRQLLKQQGN